MCNWWFESRFDWRTSYVCVLLDDAQDMCMGDVAMSVNDSFLTGVTGGDASEVEGIVLWKFLYKSMSGKSSSSSSSLFRLSMIAPRSSKALPILAYKCISGKSSSPECVSSLLCSVHVCVPSVEMSSRDVHAVDASTSVTGEGVCL